MADIKATTKTFPEFMDKLGKTPISANMASYIGHGAIRNKVMGYSPEAPSPEQMEEMKRIVREAMEAGAVCIASNIEANRQLLENGVNGFLVNDAAEAAAVMDQIRQHKVDIDAIRRAAYTKIITEYDLDKRICAGSVPPAG